MEQLTDKTGLEKKAELARQVNALQQQMRDLQTYFSCTTPMAKQLTVWGDIEKMIRAAEKVKTGFQELVL